MSDGVIPPAALEAGAQALRQVTLGSPVGALVEAVLTYALPHLRCSHCGHGASICGLCGGYGAANAVTHEPVSCMACGRASDGVILIALDRNFQKQGDDGSQNVGLRVIDGGALS